MLNRNALFVGGIRPHYYCLPVREAGGHRAALRRAATGGDPRFFFGTDSAPHAMAAKEAACGCAGVFSAPVALGLPCAGFRRGGGARPARGLREPLRPGVLRAAAERGADHPRAAGRAGGAAGRGRDRGRAGRGVRSGEPGPLAGEGLRMFGNGFPSDAEMARLTARMLLEIRAVHFRRDEPFKFTSGLASPVYIDCRKLISYPAVRGTLMDFACAKLLRDAGFAPSTRSQAARPPASPSPPGSPSGSGCRCSTSASSPRASAATRRSRALWTMEPGAAGRGPDHRRRLEAPLRRGARTAGAEVAHTFVVFYYGIFPQAIDTLARHGLRLHHLATWRDVLAEARAGAHFDGPTLDAVEAFLGAPLAWSAAHGGVTEIAN